MKTLLPVLTRSFRCVVVCLAAGVSMAHATEVPGSDNQYTLTDEDMAIIDNTRAAAEEGMSRIEIPINIHQQEMTKAAEGFLRVESSLKGEGGVAAKDESLEEVTYQKYLFVSSAMGEEALDAAYSIGSNDQSVLIVFRGVVDHENYHQSVQMIQRSASKYQPVPRVAINPTLFRDHNIISVPSIALLNEHGAVLSLVVGHLDPTWLIQQYTLNKEPYYGHKGPSTDVEERDLTEVMIERASKIDWAEKRELAKARFWQKQVFNKLPDAQYTKSRAVDPSIVATADIPDGRGGVLVPIGTRINPLDIKPFNQALFIFNPTDARQLDYAKKAIPLLRKQFARVTVIITELDQHQGWKSYATISNDLDSHVFTLTPDIINRFELQVVPSVVSAKDSVFVIDEIALGEHAQ